jgi:hypothetical protein
MWAMSIHACELAMDFSQSLANLRQRLTHNRHYATFDQFTDAILKFFRKTLPDKWREFRDTVTDNFRIISHDEYKLI